MKTLLLTYLVFTLGLQLAGCRSLLGDPPIEVELFNFSSDDIREAEAHFGEALCSWGYVSSRVSASHLSFSQPITDEAVLTWRGPKGPRRETVNVKAVFQHGVRGLLSFRLYDDRIDVRFFPKR
jgi:hypothetical protein